MKIKINYKKTFLLDDKLEPNERLLEVNKMLKTVVQFDDDSMTVEEFLRFTWDKPTSINIMDLISIYLSKMPEQNGKEDKFVLSNNDVLEMNKGVRRTKKHGKNVYTESKYKTFIDLSLTEQSEIGISSEMDNLS